MLSFENEKLPSPLTQLVAGFQNIKLVTQDTKLLPNHTILENIIFPIRLFTKEKQKEKSTELLKIFGLEHLQNRLPRQISGGQRQRATIAQALANSPDVLLLDEPFSHLDNENRNILREILCKISKNDTSIILVTHQAQEALELGDRIAVLAQNKILQIGTPQNIYQKPISEKVALLLGNIVFLNWKNEKKAIRPENLKIYTENTPEKDFLQNTLENKLVGVVKNIFFMGFYYEISILLKKSSIFENDIQNNNDNNNNIIQIIFLEKILPIIGQEVYIYFDENDFLW
jgi:iron(III) transport system ATP-binding protein